MRNIQQNIQTVMEQLDKEKIQKTTIKIYADCFNKLVTYLTEKELIFSDENLKKWLDSLKNHLSEHQFSMYTGAINRLRKVYNPSCRKLYSTRMKKMLLLADDFQKVITDLVNDYDANDHTKEKYIYGLVKILTIIQNRNCIKIKDISYEDLFAVNSSFENQTYHTQVNHREIFRKFIIHITERYNFPYGYKFFSRIISFQKGLCWNNVSEEQISMLRNHKKSLSLPVFLDIQEKLIAEMNKNDYAHNTIRTVQRISQIFYVFLESHNLEYSIESGRIWLSSLEKDGEYKAIRRVILLFEQAYNNKEWNLSKTFNFRKTKIELIPQWCKENVEQFLIIKRKEGMQQNTINMYSSSVYRFCSFLNSIGINSFEKITYEDIKKFNLADIHRTPAGKNAYNSRIRYFLDYLGENGFTSNKYLSFALPFGSAPRETLVITLTDEEQQTIRNMLHENNGLSLRKKAMLQLGLYMGIRSIDITNLLIDNIDWKNQSMKIIQQKTGYEICLPMPVEVANAVFNYIIAERHNSESRKVFLTEKAPYGNVSKGACLSALKSALPERKVPFSGFHVTRKTFATNMLRNGTSPHEVAEALGHRGLETVSRYLSVDDNGMKNVCLSLKELGLSVSQEVLNEYHV